MARSELIDAFNELLEVERETEKLQQALSSSTFPSGSGSAEEWIDVLGFASAVEKVYSGCERVLELISKQVDKQAISKSEDWHRQLLLRMRNEWPDVRPPVLSDETFRLLNDLRSFRHRQRNTYGSDLDSSRVAALAKEAILLPGMLRADVEALAASLKN